MINVTNEELKIILDILKKYVLDCEVRVFGSRVNGISRNSSDLDLAIVGNNKLDFRLINDLTEAFQESDLPFRVDILDWHTISPEFQKVIEEGYEILPLK